MKKSFYLLIFLPFALTYCSSAQHTTTSPDSIIQENRTSRSDSLQARSDYIRGITEFELQSYKNALDYLTKAYVVLPNDPAINYALADTYLKLDDMDNAEYYAGQSVQLDPDNKWYRLKLAQINQANGDLQGAEEQLQTILSHHPRDVDLLNKIVALQEQEGNFRSANRTLDRLLRLNGEDPQIYYQKFLNYNKLNESDSAVSVLEHIYQLDPDNPTAIHTLGEYYESTGKQQKAKSLYRHALQDMPGKMYLIMHLAGIYLNEARWDSAGVLLESVVSDQNVDPAKKVKLIDQIIKETQKKNHSAILDSLSGRLIHSFLNTNPDNATAHAIAARYQLTQGDRSGAIREFQTSVKLDSTNDVVWQQLIQLQYSQRNYDHVITTGQKAARSVPDNTFIQFAVGSAYMMKGHASQAIPWLKRATTLPARRNFKSVIYSTLGDACSAVGDTAAADSSYQQAILINPVNDNALNNYAYFLAVQGKQLDRARTMALKAISIAPDNPAYLDTIGWVFYKQGNYAKARDYILKSIKNNPSDADVMEHLGDVYQQMNDMNDARYWWQKAFQKDSTKRYLKDKLSR